ncbi:MAG: hypothetical protein KGL35_25930 [Bradyrhizobium sp.]|nr:hypothetical protein [Bradyrhizobium sp.]HQT76831.1 hypothetical protein [Rhodopila sp.]
MIKLIILAIIGACAYAIYHFRKTLEAKAAAEQAALRRSWGLIPTKPANPDTTPAKPGT